MRQQQLRHLVELAYLLTAFNFAPDFVVAEVPWVALQQSNFVQSLRVFEQAIQREFCRRVNVINYNGLKTTLLLRLRERLAEYRSLDDPSVAEQPWIESGAGYWAVLRHADIEPPPVEGAGGSTGDHPTARSRRQRPAAPAAAPQTQHPPREDEDGVLEPSIR
jgi:hypothetical protein